MMFCFDATTAQYTPTRIFAGNTHKVETNRRNTQNHKQDKDNEDGGCEIRNSTRKIARFHMLDKFIQSNIWIIIPHKIAHCLSQKKNQVLEMD